MTKLISDAYRTQNAILHAKNKKFGSAGHAWTDRVMGYLGDSESYLDYGCGKGQLADAIDERVHVEHFVRRYDPVTCPDMPEPADFVTCCDVLEHVEPEYLDEVLAHIGELVKKRGLLVISMRPSNKKLPDGRNAHLILEKEPWWLARLAPHFGAVEVVAPIKEKRVGVELAVLVTPKG